MTELSLTSTEAYNTACSGTPRSDFSSPAPTLFLRPQYKDHEYEKMNAIKEEDCEDEDVGELKLPCRSV